MGAQKSIHAGKAKIDLNVDFTHKLCAVMMLPQFRDFGSPVSLIIGSLHLNHPNLFGKSEKLDVSWDKGLYDSSFSIAFRRPRPEWLAQQAFSLQYSMSPEIGVHGVPAENFSRTASGGVNLCRFSVGMDLNESASSHWSSKTSVKFEHVSPVDDDWRSISRDLEGFPLTCSGNAYDNMIVLKQESRFTKANDQNFTRLTFQIEQGIPVLSKWIIFNRFKFAGSKGVKLGPALLLTSLTGGSIVGDMAPHQAFAIGGPGSVRGYGEGAVGTGRSCLVGNTEMTLPLHLSFIPLLRYMLPGKMFEGAVFCDFGTDLDSGCHVPGDPAMRHGKPGRGLSLGCGLRFKSSSGQVRVDYAVNAFEQGTLYYTISTVLP